MTKRKWLIIIFVGLMVVALVALMGGMLGRKTTKVGREVDDKTALRCAWDGIKLNALYQVDAFLAGGSTTSFCSIYCATRWLEENRGKVIYFTVVDEITGQKFDSTLGYFVESDVITVPEVKNRVHAFASKTDALRHAQQFKGRLIPNPFGEAFAVPQIARLDTLRVGTPSLPDALPIRLALFKPIFKENRLHVDPVLFQGEPEGQRLLSEDSLDGILCDLPTGLVLSTSEPPAQIVKNVLRPNPYRALFAIVCGMKRPIRDLAEMEGQSLAVPRGVSFRFYAEFYLAGAGVSPDGVVIREVEDVQKAWDLLNAGEVSAAVLRTPYTDMAVKQGLPFLADDRNLPWMSVLVFKTSVIKEKSEAVRRFVFALEQSVLALNLKPDEYRTVLEEKGGIPEAFREHFPMPIFEGANAPSQDEIAPVLGWLVEKELIKQGTTYQELINTQFLPSPEDVGLAFCCR